MSQFGDDGGKPVSQFGDDEGKPVSQFGLAVRR